MSSAARRAVFYNRSQFLSHNLRSTKNISALPLSIHQTQLRRNTSSTPATSDDVHPQEATAAEEKSTQGSKTSTKSIIPKNFNKLVAGAKELKRIERELKNIHAKRRSPPWTVQGSYIIRGKLMCFHDPGAVRIEKKRVFVRDKPIPNIWLRDNCQCSSCVHEATRQRLLDTFSIPQDIEITEVTIKDGKVHIEFSDGHKSECPVSMLNGAALPADIKADIRQGLINLSLWDASIAASPPNVSNNPSESIQPILKNIRQYGFCYVDNTPFDTPDPTEQLLRRIAFIRETHYGGFYDFTADLASKDTAYTNIALEAHTDTTYFSDPAGLQAFHLLSHTDGSGGASLLVDGFKVAADLKQQDPEAYHVLATVNIHAHASGNEGISIQPYRGFPVLEHDPTTGELLRVRWNTADRAGIGLPIDTVGKWYDAARKFDALLKKKENEYWEQLTPGRVLIFDNWRVLHGRSAFTGKRRICGAYLNRDDWISRFKMEEFGREKVLASLASG